jgi:hypothetical protein
VGVSHFYHVGCNRLQTSPLIRFFSLKVVVISDLQGDRITYFIDFDLNVKQENS